MNPTLFQYLKNQLSKYSSQRKNANLALLQGIKERDLFKMKKALSQGADVESKFVWEPGYQFLKYRVFHIAMSCQFKEGIFLLLEHGATVHNEDIAIFMKNISPKNQDFCLEVGIQLIRHGWTMPDSANLRISKAFNSVLFEKLSAEKALFLEEKSILKLKQHLNDNIPPSNLPSKQQHRL